MNSGNTSGEAGAPTERTFISLSAASWGRGCFGGGGAEEGVGEEAVAVGARCYQIAPFPLDPLDDFFDRFAVCELRLGGDAGGLKLLPDFSR